MVVSDWTTSAVPLTLTVSMRADECRTQTAQRGAWDQLPQELLGIVMQKLDNFGGLDAVLPVRLVSRAWHAAFKQFPGTATCKIDRHNDASAVCSIMPAMSSIEVRVEENRLDLHQLYDCSNLRALSISKVNRKFPDEHPLTICLAQLPQKIQSLELWGAKMSAPPDHGSALTKVSLCCAISTPKEIWKSLQGLPQLKVLHSYQSGPNFLSIKETAIDDVLSFR